MKVNRIIALRLMLSVAVIMVLQVAVKNQVQNASRATGWNVDSKKASSSKKQVAGPG
jgi:hypothetical protein